MVRYDADIKEQALSLVDGDTMQGVCPACGRTSSFYITRKGPLLLYIDHSVHCTFSGTIGSRGAVSTTARRKPRRKDWTLRALLPEERHFLRRNFRIVAPPTLRMCTDDHRMYLPQYSWQGHVAGYIARAYPQLTGHALIGPKAIWRQMTDGPLDLYFPSPLVYNQVVLTKRLVLVEDYISALRINSQLKTPTCALGGTSIYPEHIERMQSLEVKQLSIILDSDAITKAVKLKRALSLGTEVNLIMLSGADPKDMTLNQLQCEIGSKI